jgi:N-acylneuraminate cytidylyltransferase
MKFAGIIFTRAGSKRVLGKNLINLAGKPLIYYSIRALLSSEIDDLLFFSDSINILDKAAELGVIKNNCFLLTENQTNDSMDLDTVIYQACFDNYKSYFEEYDFLVLVQATSPLLTCEEINRGINLMKTGKYDSVFSVVKSNDILIWNKNYMPINYNPENRRVSQVRGDDSLIYIETGGFYIISKSCFEKYKCRICGRIGVCEIPFWSQFEVDTYEDLFNIQKLLVSESVI